MSECSGPDCDHPSHGNKPTMDTPPPQQDTPQQSLPPIITISDPRHEVLRVPSQLCNIPPTPHEYDAITTMEDILTEMGPAALGIAAVQVGVPRRIFVLRMRDGELRAFVNPVIQDSSIQKSNKLEGCLSVPGSNFRIPRPHRVTVNYTMLNGEQRTDSFTGVYARAICHEMDHLNGKLITEYVNAIANLESHKLKIRMVERHKARNKSRTKAKLARKSKRQNRKR